MDRSADIAVVGAGIVGLAHAYMALKKGYRVVLFERDQFAVGASVRNFGLLWPIGQEPGVGLERALRSREHWKEVSAQAGFWSNSNGSMHVVYHDDELEVLHEFMELYKDSAFECKLLSPKQVGEKSPVVREHGLKGGLWSKTEGTVYSREAIRRIPLWLQEKYGLILKFGHVVTEVSMPTIKTARETWLVNKVFVCSGADFETLYPQEYDKHPVSKCKLQMMKAIPSKPIDLGPSLCAGLTLRHYAAFTKCPSLKKLDDRYDAESDLYKKHGVHVLLAQNNYGELIIGDSHHYSKTVEPFDLEEVNDVILNYRNINLIVEPEKDVTIVTGLGGAGMTLSFGLAEEIIGKL
jgi:D-hydroxyproline dehydrogenase subunit beta